MEKSVLDLTFKAPDLNKKTTIREYVKELVCALINEGDGFSSKRPFGESSWDFNMFKAVLKNGYCDGVYDKEKKEIVEINPNEAAKVITQAIQKEF